MNFRDEYFPTGKIKYCLEEFIDNEWNIIFIGTIADIAEYCNCSYSTVHIYVKKLLYKPELLKYWLLKKYMIDTLAYVKEYKRDMWERYKVNMLTNDCTLRR